MSFDLRLFVLIRDTVGVDTYPVKRLIEIIGFVIEVQQSRKYFIVFRVQVVLIVEIVFNDLCFKNCTGMNSWSGEERYELKRLRVIGLGSAALEDLSVKIHHVIAC